MQKILEYPPPPPPLGLNPFQIEFTVLPAKSDSESNLEDRIKRHLLTCVVLYELMFNIVLALYYTVHKK